MIKDYNREKMENWLWYRRNNFILILLIINLAIWSFTFFQTVVLGYYTFNTSQPSEIVIVEPTGDVLVDVLTGTKMEGAIDSIKKTSEFYDIPVEVFLGIANAESSFNRFPEGSYNPFGIMQDAENVKRYTGWQHCMSDFGYYIRYWYFNQGLDTPETMLLKYVGYENPHWVRNVEKYWSPEM